MAPSFDQLFERVAMINRIHGALRSTLNLDDIYSIIMTAVISRSVLGLSRVILLDYDAQQSRFAGLTALGASSREEHEKLQQDICDEEKRLEEMVRDLHRIDPAREEEAIFSQSLRELSSHSYWITAYQKFSAANALEPEVKKLQLPWPVQNNGNDFADFVKWLVEDDSCHLVSHSALISTQLDDFAALLPRESLWQVIRTNKGPRLLLIADNIFGDRVVGAEDLLHINWFCGQVALALENAQMYHNLEQAFNELRELDLMKTNFLATISHELRTPLTAITGYLQLLLDRKIGELSKSQDEVLERIQAHSDMLTGKVNDIIEIAELDADRNHQLPLNPVDPLNILMNVLPRVEARRSAKRVNIQPVLKETVPKVLSNERALERIFFHLLDNAVKFSDSGSVVRIEFGQEGDALSIGVIDQGIGISREKLRKIFDAFYQVDSQLTRSYEGLGIGLAIIKKQIELTRGRIQVESSLGEGSVFTVTYPIVP